MKKGESQRRWFAAVAFVLGLNGGQRGDVRTKLFYALAEGDPRPGGFRKFDRTSQLVKWFEGSQGVSRKNLNKLAPALSSIAASQSRPFAVDWFGVEFDEILRRARADKADFEVFYASLRAADTRPTLTIDVVVRPDVANYLRTKYFGAYLVYRYSALEDVVFPNLFVFGPYVQPGIASCLLHSGGMTPFRGIIIPTPDALQATLYKGGERPQACSITIARQSSAKHVFAGTLTGLAHMADRVPFAEKCIIARAESLSELRADIPSCDLQIYDRLFTPYGNKHALHRRLKPWLGLQQPSDVPAHFGLGPNAMWISGRHVHEALGDLVEETAMALRAAGLGGQLADPMEHIAGRSYD